MPEATVLLVSVISFMTFSLFTSAVCFKMVQTRSKNEPELLHIFTNLIHLLGIRVLKHAGGNCTTGVSYLFHDFFHYLRAQSTNVKMVQTRSKNEPDLLHILTNLIHLLRIRVLKHAGGNCTTGFSY